MNKKLLMLPLLLALVGGCDGGKEAEPDNSAEPAPSAPTPTSTPLPEVAEAEAKELDWDALIPADWRPDKLMESYNVDELEDDDPRAQEMMDKLKVLWDKAPVVVELDGSQIRLPGFVVPLETDGDKVSSFLLVPYYGACIHVPPPPANQTVYVVTEPGEETRQELFDTVWVTGTLQVKHTSSEVGDAGYTIQADKIEPYEE